MKIFSPPGAAFPGIAPVNDPPSLFLPGVNLAAEFAAFAAFVEGKAAAIRPSASTFPVDLDTAMYYYFISFVKAETGSASLMTKIASAYTKLELGIDREELYQFCLYSFITLFHFVAWYVHERTSRIVRDDCQDYVTAILKSTYLSNRLEVDESFYAIPEFIAAFDIDLPLLKEVTTAQTYPGMTDENHLGKLIERQFGALPYLSKKKPGLIRKSAARAVFRTFVQTFRQAVNAILLADIKRLLTELRSVSPAGSRLAAMYGKYKQYALGNGTGTKSMFKEPEYGLLFFDYELGTFEDDKNICKSVINGVPLFEPGDDSSTAFTFIYYGLDGNHIRDSDKSPRIEIEELCSGEKSPPSSANKNALQAVLSDDHRCELTNAKIKPTFCETISYRDFLSMPDALRANLKSSAGTNPEEMIYIVFKHTIPDPRRPSPPPSASLSSERWLLNNEFQLTQPGSTKVPPDAQPAAFKEPSSSVQAMVAALVADPGVEITILIQGLGIGFPADPHGKGDRKLIRAADQSDRPSAPGYDDLRYAQGWIEYYPGQTGRPGWLVGHVTGFVSPLRCTWAEHMTSADVARLQSLVDPHIPKDAAKKPVYNSVLSAFRAFAFCEAMFEGLLFQALVDDVPAAQFHDLSVKLKGYIEHEALVNVILPSGREWPGPLLKYSDISKFY